MAVYTGSVASFYLRIGPLVTVAFFVFIHPIRLDVAYKNLKNVLLA